MTQSKLGGPETPSYDMPSQKAASGSNPSSVPGPAGRKRTRRERITARPTSPIIEISSDDEHVSPPTQRRPLGRDAESRTSGSSTAAHVREVFEAACEANVALRQEHERKTSQLEKELRTAEDKVATLQREATATVLNEDQLRNERDAVCDTLAALQQELEVAHALHDRATQDLRAAVDKGARDEEELKRAHVVRRQSAVLCCYLIWFSHL